MSCSFLSCLFLSLHTYLLNIMISTTQTLHQITGIYWPHKTTLYDNMSSHICHQWHSILVCGLVLSRLYHSENITFSVKMHCFTICIFIHLSFGTCIISRSGQSRAPVNCKYYVGSSQDFSMLMIQSRAVSNLCMKLT